MMLPFGEDMDTAENNKAQEDLHSQGDKDQAIMLNGTFPYITWANRKANRA